MGKTICKLMMSSPSFLLNLPGKELAGMISVKHVYEIALVKAKDQSNDGVALQTICNQIIGDARTLGIEVVKHLEAKEYGYVSNFISSIL